MATETADRVTANKNDNVNLDSRNGVTAPEIGTVPISASVTDAGCLHYQHLASRNGLRCGYRAELYGPPCGRVMEPGEPVVLTAYGPAPECVGCHPPEQLPEGLYQARPCAQCGRTIYQYRPGHERWERAYCSPRCHAAYIAAQARARRAQARQGLVCPVCGGVFAPPRRDAVTCSAACRQKAYRRRLHDSHVHREGTEEAAG